MKRGSGGNQIPSFIFDHMKEVTIDMDMFPWKKQSCHEAPVDKPVISRASTGGNESHLRPSAA